MLFLAMFIDPAMAAKEVIVGAYLTELSQISLVDSSFTGEFWVWFKHDFPVFSSDYH